MRRRNGPNHVPSSAELLHTAAAAGVDEMDAEERRAWLNERGWTSPEYLRAELDARRAEHRRRAS